MNLFRPPSSKTRLPAVVLLGLLNLHLFFVSGCKTGRMEGGPPPGYLRTLRSEASCVVVAELLNIKSMSPVGVKTPVRFDARIVSVVSGDVKSGQILPCITVQETGLKQPQPSTRLLFLKSEKQHGSIVWSVLDGALFPPSSVSSL